MSTSTHHPRSQTRPVACRWLRLCTLLLLTLPGFSVVHAEAPYPADAVVFVSGQVVDQILSAADNSEYTLPGLNNASVRVIAIRSDFAATPGQLKADFEAQIPGIDKPLRLQASGRLVPERDPQDQQRLLLRPMLSSLRPRLENGGGLLDNAMQIMTVATLQGALNSLAESMPALDFGLQRDITLARPPSTHPTWFTVGQAEVSADLQVPAMSMTLQVSTWDLRFSERGLFALLDIRPPGSAISSTARGDVDVAALDALVPAGEQTFIHLRGDALARLAMDFNSLPQKSRTLSLYSTWSKGKLFSRKRLGMGCGSYGRLINPGAVAGAFTLGAMQAYWTPQGLALQLPLWVEMGARAKVSVNGFPAPCGLTSPRPRCRCAKGKTNFPVQSRVSEEIRLFGGIGFAASDDGSIEYQVELSAPPALKLSPQLQLGRIGSLTVPATLPVPTGVVSRGTLPLLLHQQGRIRLGIPATLSLGYQLRLENRHLRVDASGLSAVFSLSLQFQR